MPRPSVRARIEDKRLVSMIGKGDIAQHLSGQQIAPFAERVFATS
ncbi:MULTISPECIES: hypothetical protein [Streptomyces]|nr:MULTISPECIES: hypothetical protein [Streptomyces]